MCESYDNLLDCSVSLFFILVSAGFFVDYIENLFYMIVSAGVFEELEIISIWLEDLR